MKSQSKFSFRVNNFDLLRLLAALQVAFVHSVEHLDVEVYEPFFTIVKALPGVPIFFVISGFLISAAYERSPDIRNYYQNRLLRIYPALWVCFAFSVFCVLLIAPPSKIETTTAFVWFAAQISIGQFYNPDFLRGYGVGVLNGSLWTIPIELQFYIALPVIFSVLKKGTNANSILLMSLLFFLGFSQLFNIFINPQDTTASKLIGVSLLPYLYFFLIGVLMQQNIKLVENFLKGRFHVWLIVFIAASAASSFFGLQVTGNLINPISGIALCLLTISFAYSNTHLFSSLLEGNDISYGLYIYHMVVINALIELQFIGGWRALLIGLLVSVLLSILSWRLVEKPALRLKRNSIHKM